MTFALTSDHTHTIQAIINTVAYADIFDYPLTLAEIHRYLTGESATCEAIAELLRSANFLQRVENYYTLKGREAIVSIRKRRESEAVRLWDAARKYGRIISLLPFVRMLAVTGSLSMNNVEANADIDYLIITVPGRLWLCRLMVLVVARLAACQGFSLCPNYVLTENALQIEVHSLYAAHEFAQMVPLSGLEIYEQMRRLNPWVVDFLPNAAGYPNMAVHNSQVGVRSKLQNLFEWFLLTPIFNWFEGWEMNRKINKLSIENAGNPEAVFRADECKGHSNRHGQRTEILLKERFTRLSLKKVK